MLSANFLIGFALWESAKLLCRLWYFHLCNVCPCTQISKTYILHCIFHPSPVQLALSHQFCFALLMLNVHEKVASISRHSFPLIGASPFLITPFVSPTHSWILSVYCTEIFLTSFVGSSLITSSTIHKNSSTALPVVDLCSESTIGAHVSTKNCNTSSKLITSGTSLQSFRKYYTCKSIVVIPIHGGLPGLLPKGQEHSFSLYDGVH